MNESAINLANMKTSVQSKVLVAIKRSGVRHHCPCCGEVFLMRIGANLCPHCGSSVAVSTDIVIR